MTQSASTKPYSDQGEGKPDLSQDEIAVIMQMSGDFGYPAAQISADLHYEQPDAGWTPRKVNKIQRALHEKGYADFGLLTCEDTNQLKGRGYWLRGKGCDIRYGRVTLSTPETGA